MARRGARRSCESRVRECVQILDDALHLVRPLMVGDGLLECFAALALTPCVEQILGIAAVAVLFGLGLVLGIAGVAALGVGLGVDQVLGASRASRRWVSAWVSIRSWASRAWRRSLSCAVSA